MKISTMKKYLIASLLIIASFSAFSQRYVCKNGEISFFSETPMENISAINKNVTAIIDVPTNNIAVKLQMTDFSFPNKLMQEHFNENYMESEKYPTGVFSGKINETIDFTKDGTYPISATGKFIIHGVTQNRTLKGTLTIKGNSMALDTNFDVKLADHKIDIPTVVVAKIAESISVKSKFNFTKQ